jgi:hypothetical protein
MWYKGGALVVTEEDKNHQGLLEVYHNSLTAGHSGAMKTLLAIA